MALKGFIDSQIDIIGAIRSVPLFFNLTTSQLEKIADISRLVEIDPGDQPIHEGDPLDSLYIILEGEVSIDIFVPTHGLIKTCKLGPLDILGWSAMTPIVRRRTGTITALTHCRLIRLNAVLLTDLCEQDHDIGFDIYRRLANVTAYSFLTTRLHLMNLIADRK